MNASELTPEPVRVELPQSGPVTVKIYAARDADAGASLILAHGAGANQDHPFMTRYGRGLAIRGVETITFNFVYTEEGRRLPDNNRKLETCYREVIEAVLPLIARNRSGTSRLVIGGKSMGGRIASQIAALGNDQIDGVVLLGYPLHPPGHPEKLRTKHLSAIRAPMLFVQGSRDAFGTPAELGPFVAALPARVELCVIEGGDHSFKVPKSAGVAQDRVDEFVLDTVAKWVRQLG